MPDEQTPPPEEVIEEPAGDEQWQELDRRVKGLLDDALGRHLSKEALHPILDDYFGGLAPEGDKSEPNGSADAGPGDGAAPGDGGAGEPAAPKSPAGARTEGGGVLTFLLGKPARK